MKRVVDLFAGCGGMSLGFQNVGFEIVGAFENWQLAVDCYAQNFNHPVYTSDLSDIENSISAIQALNPDIIIGGPPCQDFSHAGKRIEDKRAGLTETFAEIVACIRPRWFVMENVDRAMKSLAYKEARSILVDAGYGLTEKVLDASLCGVPQKRKRFFCIGSLNHDDDFLTQFIESKLNINETTLRDYFGATLDFDYYYRHPRNYSRRAVFSVDEPAPTMRGVNRPVPKGYPGHPGDACALNPSIRALTTLERALIQTFPADFKWIGTKTDMEQMIGNAVPVKLSEFVAKSLLHHIYECEKDKKPQVIIEYSEFYNWLCGIHKLSEKVIKDTVSRLKRANTICELPPQPDSYYLFLLEHSDGYRSLTPTVRSQVKRAVTLYANYCCNVQQLAHKM